MAKQATPKPGGTSGAAADKAAADKAAADKAAAENKIPQGMVPVRILKPIQGYGYHTNDEGIISEEVIKEKDLVKNGFIELIK